MYNTIIHESDTTTTKSLEYLVREPLVNTTTKLGLPIPIK